LDHAAYCLERICSRSAAGSHAKPCKSAPDACFGQDPEGEPCPEHILHIVHILFQIETDKRRGYRRPAPGPGRTWPWLVGRWTGCLPNVCM
jgi:hypothetical protein